MQDTKYNQDRKTEGIEIYLNVALQVEVFKRSDDTSYLPDLKTNLI